MQDFASVSWCCAENRSSENTQELNLFEKHVDDIVCTVKGNTLITLDMQILFTIRYNSLVSNPDRKERKESFS